MGEETGESEEITLLNKTLELIEALEGTIIELRGITRELSKRIIMEEEK